MDFDIEKPREIPILAIAKELGIDVKGRKANCFIEHKDRNPSLSFNVEKNYWHCFGCGASGDGIKLVCKYFHMDFKGACSWLWKRFYGMDNSKMKSIRLTKKHNSKRTIKNHRGQITGVRLRNKR